MAERAEDEPAFKKVAAAEKKGQRDALRAQNEEEFKAKRADEKQNTREALRAKNEEEFKVKRAADEKRRQDALRTKDEEGLKKMGAAKKKNQYTRRVQDEPEFKAKMAAKEKKRQDALREKDELGLKQKAAAKKKNQREREVTCQFDMIRSFWRGVEGGLSYSCVCCHKMKFDNQVVEFEEPLISKIGQQWVEEAIGEPDPKQERNGQYYICHYCKNKLLQKRMPNIFLLARSCLLITLIKCLKGHKFLGSLFECVLKMYLSLSLSLYFYLSLYFFGQVMSPHLSDQMSQRSQVSRVAL